MRPLFDFAYFPNWPQTLDELDDLAQEETWEYKHTPTRKPKPILASYFNYTFKRLLEENKVVEQEDKACFNTGLVTDNQEDIFAFFEQK